MKLTDRLLQAFRRAATNLLVNKEELIHEAMTRLEDRAAINAALAAEGFRASDIAFVAFKVPEQGREEDRGIFAKCFRRQGVALAYPQSLRLSLGDEDMFSVRAGENTDAIIRRAVSALDSGMIVFETQGQGEIAIHPGYYEVLATNAKILGTGRLTRALPVTTLVCNADLSGQSDFNVAGAAENVAKILGRKSVRANRDEVFGKLSAAARYPAATYPFLES